MESKYKMLKGYRRMGDEEDGLKFKNRSCMRKSKSAKTSLWYYWILFKTMYPTIVSSSVGYTLVLFLTGIAKQFNIYYIGLVPSKFYLALLDGSREEFKNIIWEMCILVITVSLCITTESFFQDLLALSWRCKLTNRIHSKYFKGNNIQLILHNEIPLDNPDQRITQDIYRLTTQMAEIFVNILLKPFIILYYTYQVWTSVGWIGVAGVYSLFLLSVIINKTLLNPVVNKVISREQWEGDFRYYHVLLREHGDSVALQRGFHVEAEKIGKTFRGTLESQRTLLHWRYPLQMGINITDYTGSLATYGIIAIPVFSGWYQEQSNAALAGLISKSVFFTIYLINQFTTIIEQANQLSLVSGFSIRVGELLDRLNKIENEREEEVAPLSQELHSIISSNQADNLGVVLLSLREVSIYSPDNRILVNKLTMDISVDCNTIIMGPSGCGKSALIKMIAGIWPHKDGVVSTWKPLQLPHAIFIPQTPYLSSGSFVDQVIYPLRSTDGDINRDRVVTSITAANLTHLLDRLGMEEYVSLSSWNELSSGEKQKIYFARLFYHQPRLAVLDEATSSMDEDTETQLYQTCLDLEMTLLSIGHRSSLKKFHKNILSICRGGSWSLQLLD